MKRWFVFIALSTIISLNGVLAETVHIMPIDSMYSNWMVEFYPLTEQIAPEIWPGMKFLPVCTYRIDGPVWLYNHPNPPDSFKQIDDKLWVGAHQDLVLFGATSMEINDVRTAVVPYGDGPREKVDFMAELFHEMHHAFQCQENKIIQFPDISCLITYPEVVENIALIHTENRCLLELVFDSENDFQAGIDKLYSIRLRRSAIIGHEYMAYEKCEESLEGPAVFCEYKFREAVTQSEDNDYFFRIRDYNRFFFPLTDIKCNRDHFRELKLMTGLCMCLILEAKRPEWKQEYYKSGLPLSDYFFEQFVSQVVEFDTDPAVIEMVNYFIEIAKEKRIRRFQDFKDQEGIRVSIRFLTIPRTQGLDPMNMEAISPTTIIHNTLLKLGRNGNVFSFMNGGICSEIQKNIWTHQSLFFFTRDRSDLWNEGDRIRLDLPGKKIDWIGSIVSETSEQIQIELE